MAKKSPLMVLYHRLYQAYGPQDWWPADTPFEVMVGAVLTQNTNWKNVEKAIHNLKRARALRPKTIVNLEEETLADYLRPSGYFNIKARRLRNLCEWLLEQGGEKALQKWPTDKLRTGLLSVNGVGPETADDILLYTFERPVFVIDAYTRRLLKRLELAGGDEDYETLRQFFEARLKPDVALFNEYHALIVRHAKEKCVEAAGCRHCLVEKPL